ncbi:MAG: glucosidase, partial [Roseovarius sp.]
IEALETYHAYYGDSLRVACPTGSDTLLNLHEVAAELSRRLASLFLPDADGRRPSQGGLDPLRQDADGNPLLLFHEYFDAETGRGLGASHQTGWTALVTQMLEHKEHTKERE